MTLTHENLKTLTQDSTIADITCEEIIDQATRLISGFGYDISLMTGTAGAKELSLSPGEEGWVLAVAVEIYGETYKTSGSSSGSSNAYNVGNMGMSQSTSGSNNSSSGGAGGRALSLAREAARMLMQVESELA